MEERDLVFGDDTRLFSMHPSARVLSWSQFSPVSGCMPRTSIDNARMIAIRSLDGR